MADARPPLDILLAHDRWATREVLDAAAPLPIASLDHPFEMGRGSLRATLHHTIDVIHVWTERLHGHAASPQPKPDDRTVAELIEWHAAVADRFEAMVNAADLNEVRSSPRQGKTLSAPIGGVVAHVITHSMHHRAQALNMLRHLSVTPLPQSSVFEWMLSAGVARLE